MLTFLTILLFCVNEGYGISGGTKARLGDFPSAAAIYSISKVFEPARRNIIMCGGTILTDKHVMTAGHCLSPFDVRDLTVFVGTLSKDDIPDPRRTHAFEVQEKILHPKYGRARRKTVFDMALLVIRGNFRFDAKFVDMACSPGTRFRPAELERDTLRAVGWGNTEQDRQATSLLTITEKVVPLSQCNAHRQAADPYTDFCATGGRGRATCDGDSGSPLYLGRVVVGFTINGVNACGVDGAINDVFANVYYYVPWIRDTIYNLGRRSVCINGGNDPYFDPR